MNEEKKAPGAPQNKQGVTNKRRKSNRPKKQYNPDTRNLNTDDAAVHQGGQNHYYNKSKRPDKIRGETITINQENVFKGNARQNLRNDKKTTVPAFDDSEFIEDKAFARKIESLDAEEESEMAARANAKKESCEEDNSLDIEVIGIRFKLGGKLYYFAPGRLKIQKGEFAIVETARGQELGEVVLGNTFVKESEVIPPLRPIVRIASQEDHRHNEENKLKEAEAFRIAAGKIEEHKLEMKLIEAQYTFDNTKLLFYFTSNERIDFRDLVKDLASVFRTRIELRQIGIRDEAKLIGGLGICGRPLCCSLFLTDFGQVSIKMAKEQNLSLNSAKISGICGRLMCCLRYEYETYEYEIKRTPPVDSLVKTEDGVGTVIEINPLKGMVKVKLQGTSDSPPKFYKRENVTVLQKKQ